MVAIKTFEHDLTIKSEEFISNHSVIQNFPEGQKAKKKEHGKNGGNILIEAEIAQGELQLILNGEEAGRVSNQEILSKEEVAKLKGRRGQSGRDAVYKTHCRSGGVEYRKNKRAFFLNEEVFNTPYSSEWTEITEKW